jgi:hypothetical protein
VREGAASVAARVATYALVLLLTLLLAVWGAFLVPLHVGTVPVPVSVVIALAPLVLGRAAGRLYGRPGAAAAGLVWFAVVVLLAAKRPEGDLVVPGDPTGLAFLLVGTTCAALAVGGTPGRR